MLLSDAFALYMKTKNYHWHMIGSRYREYHFLLDEHADQLLAAADVIAERVWSIGGTTIRSIGQISRLQTIHDDDGEARSATSMLNVLCNGNQLDLAQLRRAHGACNDSDDVGRATVLENSIDESERRTWFLLETISDGEHSQ